MATTKPITITTCQSLWDKAHPIIIKETEKHPFLVSMVDGTLEENNFRYYVQQDVLYLKDFISVSYTHLTLPTNDLV